MEETKNCKWYNEEFCTNGDSPCVADYCPVVEYPELCKHRETEVVKDIDVSSKLTDEEIVKALETCVANRGTGCWKSCTNKGAMMVCDNEMYVELLLDLIHRLQDENKYLKTCCDQFIADYKKELAEHEEFALKAKTEIERLTKERDKQRKLYVKEFAEHANHLGEFEKIKQQAVKDTAKEILQELYDQIDENTPKWVGAQIKIIAKRKGVEVE